MWVAWLASLVSGFGSSMSIPVFRTWSSIDFARAAGTSLLKRWERDCGDAFRPRTTPGSSAVQVVLVAAVDQTWSRTILPLRSTTGRENGNLIVGEGIT